MTTTTPDTSHLRAGMTCTIRFRHPGNWYSMTEPVTGTLEDVLGSMHLGLAVVRHKDGSTNEEVAEVVDPVPPKRWPVGTRLTDGGREAILTDEDDCHQWFTYAGPTDFSVGPWLADADVADWTPVEDDRPEVVDLPDGVELARDEARNLWVRSTKATVGPLIWSCLTALRAERSDADATHWKRVAVAPSRALPDGHITVDMSWVPESYLRLWAEGMGDVPKPEYTDTNTNPGAYLLQEAARAELARRGES